MMKTLIRRVHYRFVFNKQEIMNKVTVQVDYYIKKNYEITNKDIFFKLEDIQI